MNDTGGRVTAAAASTGQRMKVLSNTKHEAVARALIADPKSVGWRAYKSVYPKCSRHAAETGYTRLAKNAAFAARLNELKAAAAEGAVATKREALEELTKIGLANMADYVGKDDITLPVPKLTRHPAAAIQEYTVEHYAEGHGDEAKTVKKIKIKLADKRAALVDLGRHHKLFTDKFEHGGKDGGLIEGRIVVEFVHPPKRKDDEARPGPGLILPRRHGPSGGR
jgi:phage terminase small subunit